jgi:hypothetical protein
MIFTIQPPSHPGPGQAGSQNGVNVPAGEPYVSTPFVTWVQIGLGTAPGTAAA